MGKYLGDVDALHDKLLIGSCTGGNEVGSREDGAGSH